MTEKPDLPGEMNVLLDDETVDAILAGEANGSVPAEFAKVAELARAARVNAAGAEPATLAQDNEAELVAAIASAVRASSPLRTLRPHRKSRAAAVVAFAAVTFSATAAAAATNNLPPVLQDALSNAASHVGVHIPQADADRDQPASTPPASEEAPDNSATSASSASDAAPPASTPADFNNEGAPGNSDHTREPGDVSSVAHDDNPATQDDTHASTGSEGDHSNNSGGQEQSEFDSTSSDTSSEDEQTNNSGGNDTASSARSTHSKP